MKRCVLKAYVAGSSQQPERFEAQCQGVEHLLGKDLILVIGGDEDSLWLFLKPGMEDGRKQEAAAQIVSIPPKAGDVFPTIRLHFQEVRLLVEMREAGACLLVISGEAEVGLYCVQDGMTDGEHGIDMDVDTHQVPPEKDPVLGEDGRSLRQENGPAERDSTTNVPETAIPFTETSTYAKKQVKNDDAYFESLGSTKPHGSGSGEAGGLQVEVPFKTKPFAQDDSQKAPVKMSSRKFEAASTNNETDLLGLSDERKEPASEVDLKESWERMDLPSSDGYESLPYEDVGKERGAQEESTEMELDLGIDPKPNDSFRTPTVEVEDSAIEVSNNEELLVSQKQVLDTAVNIRGDAPFNDEVHGGQDTVVSSRIGLQSPSPNLSEEATAKRTRTGAQSSRHQSRESSNAVVADDILGDLSASYHYDPRSHRTEKDEGSLNVGGSVAMDTAWPHKVSTGGASSSDDASTLMLPDGHSSNQKGLAFNDCNLERVQGSRMETATHSVGDSLLNRHHAGDPVGKMSYADALKQGGPGQAYSDQHSSVDRQVFSVETKQSEESSIFHRAGKFVSAAVTTTTNLILKKPSLEAPKDWIGYNLATKTIHRRGDKITKGFFQEVESFLTSEDWNLPTLTLAAYMCNLKRQESKELPSLVVKCISSMSLSLKLGMSNMKMRFEITNMRPNVVWYDFFYNLVSDGPICAPHQDDSLWVRIFWIWNDCGLFRRIYNPALWRSIRASIASGFLSRRTNDIMNSLGADKANTLGSLLQESFSKFADFVLEHPSIVRGDTDISLHVHSASHMKELFQEFIQSSGVASESFSHCWEMFLVTVSHVRFPKGVLRDVISSAITAVSFRTLRTFDHYNVIVNSLDPSYKYAMTVKSLVRESLCEDLSPSNQGKIPRMKDVSKLLSSSTGTYLSSDRGVDVVKSFSNRAMKSSAPFGAKLRFLGDLFDKFVCNGWVGRSEDFKKHVIESICAAKKNVDPLERLQMSFRVAAERNLKIYCTDDGEFTKRVSKLLCSTDECQALLRKPELLRNLVAEETESNATTLQAFLTNQLREMLTIECLDVNKASQLLLATSVEESPPPTCVVSFAVSIFTTCFWKWSPKSINDLVAISSDSLRLVHRCIAVFTCENEYMAPDDYLKMKQCREQIQHIVMKWYRDYDAEALTKACLENVCHVEDHEIWQQIADIANVGLPTFSQMNAKCQDYVTLEDTIIRLLRGSHDKSTLSLRAIFHGYGCSVEPESAVSRLLTCYDWLLTTEESNESNEYISTKDGPSTVRELRHLREDAEAGVTFSNENSAPLEICDYFLKHPSVLFRNLLFDGLDAPISLDSLLLAAQEVKEKLSSLVLNGNFSGICHAVNIILEEKNTVEHEMSILKGCNRLELSTDNTQSFLVVAALAQAAEPLKRFIECCYQFKFTVTADSGFEVFSSIVHELSHDESGALSMQDCLDCSARLYSIFLSNGHRSEHNLKEICDTIEEHLPTLSLLGCFSKHSEVWTFVREMKWFGKEGLKRFYEQYANVTNVLLGNTASYEMSLLDAVEPTVRVISAVGGFLDEAKIVDFLSSLQGHKDIVSFLDSGTGPTDIVQVQANLSQIRDWFTVGVDEIAAVHGTFDAVWKTGEYCLRPLHLNEENNRIVERDDSTTLVLTLCYRTKETRVALQCGELNSFIQHIGLIQHENELTAASAGAFVEQHQVLSRAASNVIYMNSIGYGESGRDFFSCMVGHQHADQARELLLNAEIALRQCQSWLHLTRSNHLVSLLFWTDELLEIHKAIRRAAEAGGAEMAFILHNLACVLSRLARGNGSRQHWLFDISAAIESRKEGTFRQESSWLADVSMFLDSMHDAFGAPWKRTLDIGKRHSKIVLHTMACKRDEFLPLSLRILQDVYKDRLPENYEVFDGLVDCTSDKLAVFLERVKTFPSSVFVMINVESLEGKLQETILSFLSNPGIALEGIHLHLLQLEGSILHTAPWIRGIRWELDDQYDARDSEWRTLILDQIHVNQVSVVWSPRSGAGKTRYIQQKLSERAQDNDRAESAKVTIHERSSIGSLMEDLVAKFSPGVGPKTVHINLTHVSSAGDSEAAHWAECLNRFFFSLLVFRFVRDSTSARAFHFSESCWNVFLEFPNHAVDSTAVLVENWLRKHMPIVFLCSTQITPPNEFVIDDEARRVCTYLRAYEDGTINRKFEAVARRRLLFVLDNSGSMDRDLGDINALGVATNNALHIFDSHIGVGDIFGVIMFNSRVDVRIPVQTILDDNHRFQLRESLDQVRSHACGGTRMFAALKHAFESVENADEKIESWIVCLTDGASGDSDEIVRPYLERSRENVHLIIVGVSLHPSLESHMRHVCNKYGRREETCKGFFVHSDADISSINSAFDTVSASIPVSQTFELDGVVTENQCRRLLHKYAPQFVDRQDMLLMTFWVQFIYRRVKVFDENESFNYNETHDSLGSTLMRAMLGEVERLISNNQSRDWIGTEHTQLIYDFTSKNAPEFRLLCTAPDGMDASTRLKLEELDLPEFSIPTNYDLQQRTTLDRYLSQALSLTLKNGRIACIDDNNFILTLDFTMKLLSIHERVACQSPCVIEGETGVSKTALTRMYAILRNSAVEEQAKQLTQKHFEEIAQELVEIGHHIDFELAAHQRLEQALSVAAEAVIGNETELARDLHRAILEKCVARPNVFQEVPLEFSSATEARTTVVMSFLNWFCNSALEPMFFDVNVDSSLSEEDFVARFIPIRKSAQKILGSEAVVVVFLDEFNTSSVLGLCKEIIVDHTLAGQNLEENIVVVAACNPSRKQAAAINSRERDLGKEWASGHYQVSELPPSITKIKWSFGSLNHDQEKEFILRRLDIIGNGEESLPTYLRVALTEFISESQEAMRLFAARNIRNSLVREQEKSCKDIDFVADVRARSVVSLRDIQRVFCLFDFFASQFQISCITDVPAAEAHRNAMLLAIATVYFLRLDGLSREQFLDKMRSLPAERGNKKDLLHVLNRAMDEVIRETEIQGGVAITRGLKENVFMTFVCTLSKTPLMIVGPPGSSKTLSVNIVSDNCNGEDSSSPFYRKHARLDLFHYQCSKQSTSKELLAVFGKATQRQQRVDSAKHRCFVLMDEAGLPEEEKESLKVLHYLLEGHMSAKAEVGFVAISNHVLDAAKTNRCVMLLREEPDEDDMLSIASGVLFDAKGDGTTRAHHVDMEGKLFSAKDFALSLCQSYATMLHDDNELSWFDSFFGLRDLIHFLKAVRSKGSFDAMKMGIALQDIVFAVERNFNGVAPGDIHRITEFILRPLIASKVKWSSDLLDGAFRDPVVVIREALQSSNGVSSLSSMTRFKLIIDCSGDDSILRLLSIGGIVDLSKRSMFKLSRMPQEVALEELRLVSGVKFAALQGNLAVLSQTESINESFYDLFNQRFQAVTGRDGTVDLYANIAVGGISRRSLVRPEFECVVHVNESDMHQMPAPFLNRFEKFRLTIHDVLRSGWGCLGVLAKVFKQSRQSTSKFASVLCETRASGWVNDKQTLDSLFVDMLPTLPSSAEIEAEEVNGGIETVSHPGRGDDGNFVNSIIGVVQSVSSLQPAADDVHFIIEMATKYLRVDDAETLKLMSMCGMKQMDAQDLLQLIRNPDSEMTQVARICRILIQMLATRVSVRRLLQLATPESVFAARDCIPENVLQEYFMQEHFSLRGLVGRLVTASKINNKTNLSVVYTRSDACIHSIPTHSANRNLSLEDPSVVKRLCHFVHDNLDELVVENLSVLKSEAMLSSAIESWAKSGNKKIFLLLVDMSTCYAIEKSNYARMCAERNIDGIGGKTFILLMHYSSSGRDARSCYPALFLGGWEHFFLDGIGSHQHIGIENLIEAACKYRNTGDLRELDRITSSISDSALRLLPRILPHIASQKLFYPNQEKNGHKSFVNRTEMIQRVLRTRVGKSDIATILTLKFAKMWADHGLMNSMSRATQGLLLGTTQLSLTMSIHTVLVETFDTFITTVLMEMNQWRNLDLITESTSEDHIRELYGLILTDVPIMPLEELVLQTKSHAMQVSAVADPRNESAGVHFPFFKLVSSFIDECIETVEQTLIHEQDVDAGSGFRLPCGKELFLKSIDLIQETAARDLQTKRLSGSATSVLTAIRFVEEQDKSPERSLFDRYLDHFIEWRLGCEAQPVLADQISTEIARYGCSRNIVAIHVAAKAKSKDLLTIASIISVSESISTGHGSDDENSPVLPCASTAEQLFEPLLGHFEANVFADNVPRRQWSTSFLMYVHQIPAMLAGKLVEDLRTASRFRILYFFYILIEASTSTHARRTAAKVWKQKDTMTENELVEALSLERFLSDGLDVPNDSDRVVQELAIRHFFAPAWMNVTNVFRNNDFSFLLNAISNDLIDGVSSQLLVTSLQRVCFHDTRKQMAVFSESFAPNSVTELVSRLSCDQISVFSVDGKRTCIPHYVPDWLIRDGAALSSGAELDTYLASYIQCFHCRLSRVLFDMLLQLYLCEAEGHSSENLFVGLLRCIHEETTIQRLDQTRLARSRKAGDEKALTGSPLGAIVLDVKLTCFVAKVAHEISIDDRAAVFAGVYAEEASSLLEELMSIGHLKWQEFIVGSILRKRGEGKVASSLGQNGQLSHMLWCKEWIRGMPAQLTAVAESLKGAVDALAEAVEDEDRKSRDQRLCPHCRQPFAILQRNCGAFVCGRDYHSDQGQAGHGCGRAFQLDSAPYYSPDEELLAALRATVETERAKFREHENAKSLWDDARGMQIPVASFRIELDLTQNSLLPSASLLSMEGASEAESSIFPLVNVLLEGSRRASHFSLLPDLIEFYMWLHTTFRYLVTKERAFHLKVSEIMKEALLQRRFDSVSTSHIGSLWGRVTAGVNEYLYEVEYKIPHECEVFHVGFDRLENATLVTLLSEGDHPTDGNDILFLMISEIIGAYNSFVRRIAECLSSSAQDFIPLHELHPKFVATGCGGAVAMSSAMPLSLPDLNMLVASYWSSDEECYDVLALGAALQREIGLHHSPSVISNPSKCLRERFRFRDDRSRPVVDAGTSASVLVGEDGEYFANHQDYLLVCDVGQSLLTIDMPVGDPAVRRTLSDNFYSFDYNQLRLMLEGCRSLLASVVMEFVHFESVDQALRVTTNGQNPDFHASEAFQSFGFPELLPFQVQLLLTLDAGQFVEMIKFLSYQLASESHLLANLPLCMTDPVKETDQQEINSRLEHLCEDRGAKKVAELIDEFTQDILSFYELEICDASSSNRSLKGFLAGENFCDDDADPIFALLPARVTLKNYVSLRQHLHQQKLRFLSTAAVGTMSVLNRKIDSKTLKLFTQPSRGRCWLWEDAEMDDEEAAHTDNQVHSAPYNENWSLWFETRENNDAEEIHTDEMSHPKASDSIWCEDEAANHSMDKVGSAVHGAKSRDIDERMEESAGSVGEGTETFSARILQRWWRQQRSEFDNADFFGVDGDEDMFDDMFDSDESKQSQTTHAVIVETVNAARGLGASSSEGHSTQKTYEDSLTARDLGGSEEPRSVQASVVQYAGGPLIKIPPPATTEQGESLGEVQQAQLPRDQQINNGLPPVAKHRRSQEMQLYGSVEEERALGQWLNDNRLPQTVADELVELGARNIDDIVDLVESYTDLLAEMRMKPLDRLKLIKAVKVHKSVKDV